MNLRNLIEELHSRLDQREVSIRCECENLETVYLKLVDEKVLVTDRHQTFFYLATSDDSAYVKIEDLDMKEVESICHRYGVTLAPAPEDGFPSIEFVSADDDSIKDGISKVADAVDAIFQLARVGP